MNHIPSGEAVSHTNDVVAPHSTGPVRARPDRGARRKPPMVFAFLEASEITRNEWRLVAVYAGAVVSFCIGFVAFIARHARKLSELELIRRALRWQRGVCVLLLLARLPFLYLKAVDDAVGDVAGLGGALASGAGCLLAFWGFFLNSHHAIRWLFLIGQSAMVCTDTVLEVTCHYAIECRLSGRCVDERGAASGVLAAMKHGAFAAIFLDVWSILLCAYALIACGCCRARYTMRDITPGARVVLLGTRTRHARKAS